MDARPLRILIVDHSPEDRETFRRLLTKGDEGAFIVAEAPCGEAGLRLCQSDPPRCALLDCNLPDIDGLEFLSRFRAENGGDIPVIFLTDAGGETVAAAAIKLGAQDYLIKGDISGEGLRRAIFNAIERAALQREELKKQAAELRKSEERFRAFMDNSPGTAWIKDEEGRYVYLSKTQERQLGVHPGDWAGKTDFELWPAEIAQVSRNNDLSVLSDGKTREAIEKKNGSDGAPTYWWKARFLIRDAAGGQYVAGVGADITLYKKLELELQQVVERLKAADRRKDEFLAMLGHELRNPLGSIRNDAQILRRIGPFDGIAGESVGRIERQAIHMTRLVDDLLDVSRLSRGRIELKKEPLEFAALVERALQTSRPLIEKHRHELTVALPEPPVSLEGDRERLVQVITNLIDNAAKYTDDGGRIWLEAETASRSAAGREPQRPERQVEDGSTANPTLPESRRELVMRVRDSGRGISAEFLPYVFEVFAQSDRTLDRAQGGLGIGLTLVKQLVELHDGSVQVESSGRGQGSEFTLRLPILEAGRSEARLSTEMGERASPCACRVLIVEDNAHVGESMTALLRLDNYDARLANDGATALAFASSFRPHVVLLDIGLPSMSGFEVARRLRSFPEGQDILLIALTGYGDPETQKRCGAAGFDHHMIKPADVEALKALIEPYRFRFQRVSS